MKKTGVIKDKGGIYFVLFLVVMISVVAFVKFSGSDDNGPDANTVIKCQVITLCN